MSKARLGRAERAAKKLFFSGMKRAQLETMDYNRETFNGPSDSNAYAKVRPYEGSMTHGLYRSGYDPNLSSVRDTKRGLRQPARKSAKAAKAGPVKSI